MTVACNLQGAVEQPHGTNLKGYHFSNVSYMKGVKESRSWVNNVAGFFSLFCFAERSEASNPGREMGVVQYASY